MADTYILPNKQLLAALLAPLRAVLTLVIIPVLLLLVFWAVCLGMYYTTWARDTQPLASLFQAALGEMNDQGPLPHVADLAEWLTSQLHTALFIRTGLDGSMQPSLGVPNPLEGAVASLFAQAVSPIQLVALATQVFGARMALLVGMLPLVALAFALAHTDGGAERAIRRACAGRESANLYHQAKSMQFGLTGLVLMTTLSLPIHVNPLITMAGYALGMLPLAWLQGTYYKKYR